jgi:hypothetical protein
MLIVGNVMERLILVVIIVTETVKLKMKMEQKLNVMYAMVVAESIVILVMGMEDLLVLNVVKIKS